MRLLTILAPAAALLLAGAAAAQTGNPGFTAPGTQPAVPVPHEANTSDKLFARIVAQGGRAEVEFGRLAQQKGASDAVKGFARQMVEDHSKANDKLAELAKAAGIALPEGLHPDHQAKRAALEKLSGADFDIAYILGQIEDHQKTVQLLQYEIGSGQDAPMQQFAAETLPTVLGHLRHAQFVASQLTGATPPEIAPRVSSTEGGRKPAPNR